MKKILIVDDEKNIRLTLKHSLTTEDYGIDIAINGEEALEKIQNSDFDLILLDIKMPGINGMEVLGKLRKFNNKINVIMMSAYGTVEQAVEAMKLGAIDFISKPFTSNEIKDIVQQVFFRENLKQNDLSSFDNYIGFAKKCILSKNYLKAEENLHTAITIDNDAAEPHHLLGNIYEVNGKYERALNEYRIALNNDPENQKYINSKDRLVDFIHFLEKNKEAKNEE